MIFKIYGLFSSLKMTLVSGVFLLASFILILTGTNARFDPVWVTVVISGFPLFYGAFKKLFFKGIISSALLISAAMSASIMIGESFAAGEIAFIMAVGGILEDKTVERAKKGIKNLINLMPDEAKIVLSGLNGIKIESVPVETIKVNDVLRIFPGEKIPVDGEIISGSTSINQSVITGESMPVDKNIGDKVFCGTLNLYGTVDIIAVKTGKNTSLQKLINLVKDAEKNKAPVQQTVDKWAGWLVPAALITAVITYGVTSDVIRAVTILVVFCPCALALATPTAVVAAVGRAAKSGVIIKSGEALEKMGEVNCVVFDKTGTITEGGLIVSDFTSFIPSISGEQLLNYAACAESLSEHPLAKAVLKRAEEFGEIIKLPSDFKVFPGKGVKASVSDTEILCGNKAFLSENGVLATDEVNKRADVLKLEGKAVILVAVGGIAAGLIAFSDTLRSGVSETIKKLKSAGTDVIMLTGDNAETAGYMGARAGIAKIYSGLLPEDKVEVIKQLQKNGAKVAMIGDGINDAPALKTADVGVSMGIIGSDIAVESADITLMSDDISKIYYLKLLSASALKTIKFNITAAMLINLVAVILSIMSVLNPVTGALVHNAGAVLVILNAALLYDRKFMV